MKKSLLALAVLGAYAGVASAQSSVTLYGTVDLSGKYVKNDGSAKRLSLSQDGINSSQLGFRGIEDLGGGLRAGFLLLSGINADTGTANSKFWNRRSTVSLFTGAGELRLGRDYTPTFWNQTIFDAFGTNGLGSSTNVRQAYGGTRQDNSIGYFLPPNIGGFYGQAMVTSAEGGTTGDRPSKYLGGRIGFAAGPFDVAAAYSTQKYGAAFAIVNPGSGASSGTNIAAFQSQKTWNVGGSWDFGFMKLLGYYGRESLPNFNEKVASISTVVPMGQGEVHFGYDVSKLDRPGLDSKVNQLKATYVYNLSKRTAMYGTVSMLQNSDATALSVAGGSAITALPVITGVSTATQGSGNGGDSKGFELGVRHFF